MTPIQRNRSGERNTERQRDVQRKTTTEVARKHQRRRGVSSIFSVTQDDEALPQDLLGFLVVVMRLGVSGIYDENLTFNQIVFNGNLNRLMN